MERDGADADASLLVGLKRAAALLDVSAASVRAEIAAGRLVSRRIGARVLVTRTSLQALARGEPCDASRGAGG